MSEVLYEQYKDALRRGHVAALRGQLDAAAAAYREAARIAPDRALPYVGLGGVLTRLGRADDALACLRSGARPGAVGRGRDAAGAPMSWPPSAAGPRPPRRWTGWRSSSSATGAWPMPATSRAGRSSWPSRADAASMSRAWSPGSGRRPPRTPQRPTPWNVHSGSWSPARGSRRGRPARPPMAREPMPATARPACRRHPIRAC